MQLVKTVCLCVIVILTKFVNCGYWDTRKLLLKQEQLASFGHDYLSPDENYKTANAVFLKHKTDELIQGHLNDSEFLASQHFFTARDRISRSTVFSFIREMPKGGCLHIHLTAAVSSDFVFNLTYRDNLYGCNSSGQYRLHFFKDGNQTNSCDWKSLRQIRKRDNFFDDFLRNQMSLNAVDPGANVEETWRKFKSVFSLNYYMLSYRPVFEDYLYEALEELHKDNIVYVEFRGNVMPLYELNGTTYGSIEFIDIMQKVVQKFQESHQNFIGAKFIYSPFRDANKKAFTGYTKVFQEIKPAFPDFIAGFDLIGYEDKSRPLKEYVDLLRDADENFKFFFHAGETKWYGSTDINLVDAVLLNASRIGHGIALNKHPKALELVKEKNIAVEICPISNQLLKFVDDPRIHPAIGMVSEGGYRLVVGNDDPGMWKASGLSHDWYVFLMAMTSEEAGLEVFVELSMNSLMYSSLSPSQKVTALVDLKQQWDKYVNDTIFLVK